MVQEEQKHLRKWRWELCSILALEQTLRASFCQEGQCHMHLLLLGFCLAGAARSLSQLPVQGRQFVLPIRNHSGTVSGNPNSHISQHVDLLEMRSPLRCPVSGGEQEGWGGKSSSLSLQIHGSERPRNLFRACLCGTALTVLGSDHVSWWHVEVGSRKGK